MTTSSLQTGWPAPDADVRPAPGERLLRWIIVLSLVGYPIAGVAAVVLNTDSRNTSLPFRILVDLLAVAGLLTALIARSRFRLDLPIIVFLGLYLLRLMFDLGRPDMPTTGEDLLFYVSTVLIPIAGAAPLASAWNQRTAAMTMLAVGCGVSVVTLIVQFSGIGAERSLTETTGRLRFDTVDPITFGHIGVSTLLAALVAWGGCGRLQRVLLLAACAPAVAVLVLANSRSPYLALVAAIMLLLLARRRWALMAAAAAVGLGVFFSDSIQSALAGSRLVTFRDNSAMERMITQSNSIDEFSAHPLFGSGYIDPITQQYPHNLFIESAIALGVVGLGLYAWITLQAAYRSFTAIGRGELLLPLMFCQFFVLGQLSSSFFGSGALMLTMIMLSARARRDDAAQSIDYKPHHVE